MPHTDVCATYRQHHSHSDGPNCAALCRRPVSPQLFEGYRMVYDFGRTWSYEAYSSRPKSLREIRRDMHKQREWRNELDRMKIFNVSRRRRGRTPALLPRPGRPGRCYC